jgi:hypothetical protein
LGLHARNPSTDAYRFAPDELAFVAGYVGAKRLAKQVLLDGLHKGLIRWRCHELTIDEDPNFSARPPLWSSLAAARHFFWQRNPHSRIDMDWKIGSGVRVGPAMQLGSGPDRGQWPIFDLRASVTLKASLVRFHHDDVVDLLVTLGFIPRPGAPPSAKAAAEQPEIGGGSGSSTTGASATGSAVASKSSAAAAEDSAKLFVGQHPRLPGERAKDHYDRLEDLCGREYPRKTLRNRYYEIQKGERKVRAGRHGPANGPK